MRKINTLVVVIFVLLLSGVVDIYAQSDYEITQNFKQRHEQLADSINNAVDLDECLKLEHSIENFKSEYTNHMELLDKSLYPDNFYSAMDKLVSALEVKKSDNTQISQLTFEVGVLRDEILDLNRKNSALIQQITLLENSSNKDQKTIDSLRSLVSNLKSSIKKRDELVVSVVDTLLSKYIASPSNLSEAENQAFINEVKSKNIFYNVRKTIEDNVQFLELTKLNYDDLSEVKKHQMEFANLWGKIDTKLAEVYLNRNDRTMEVRQINGMFDDWSNRIDQKIWQTIDKLFKDQQISLLKYSNGQEFTDNISTFINDEIKNAEVKGSDEAEKVFSVFTYSVWFKDIKPQWIPMLIDNEMLTTAQKDSIEAGIARWQKVVAPPSFAWIYILVGVVVIMLFLLFFKKKDKSKPKEVEFTEEKKE